MAATLHCSERRAPLLSRIGAASARARESLPPRPAERHALQPRFWRVRSVVSGQRLTEASRAFSKGSASSPRQLTPSTSADTQGTADCHRDNEGLSLVERSPRGFSSYFRDSRFAMMEYLPLDKSRKRRARAGPGRVSGSGPESTSYLLLSFLHFRLSFRA